MVGEHPHLLSTATLNAGADGTDAALDAFIADLASGNVPFDLPDSPPTALSSMFRLAPSSPSLALTRTPNFAMLALPGEAGDEEDEGQLSELERIAGVVHLKEPGMFTLQCVSFVLFPLPLP
jgi:hypothetical protein